MKTKLLILLLAISSVANAQWYFNHFFYNTVRAFLESEGSLYAGLSGGGVYRSMDAGKNWEAVNNGIQFGGAYIYALCSRNDSIFAGGFGEVCFTNDKGENWTLMDLNLSLNSFVYALAIKDNYLFAGIGGHDTLRGVYRKQLGQLGWSYTSNGLPANVAVNTFLVSGNVLFVGTSQGVFTSENNGLHWEHSSFGMGEAPVVHSFYEANGLLLAGTNAGIFVSNDHGGSWSAGEGLPSTSVVSCLAGNDNSIVAGTYDGGFISHDNGLSWSDFTPQVPHIVFFASLTTLDNFYYAGTGAGIFTTNPDVAVSLSETRIVDHSGLLLYPNPIKRGKPLTVETQTGLSGIRIYDARGQLLQNIAPGNSPKNTICTAGLPPGLYIVETIHTAEAVSWKRFLVE